MHRTWNYCDLPAWLLASAEFNDNPRAFEIVGVRQSNRQLFQLLDQLDEAQSRARVFHEYMSVQFHLHEWDRDHSDSARRSLKNSYVRFLRGWGVDSSSVEAAVLKAWVESRIGIPPNFHRGRLADDDPEGLMAFATDRMRGSERTNAINQQLDLLFTFGQYELARRHPGERWFDLFRGTHDADQYEVLQELGARERLVRLNNLCSFTPDQERAFEFGGTVWQARVPLVKVFFWSRLLPDSILKGEDEFLIIGGVYRVRKVL
jgi:NAD+---dinitrogen-reductase ADP-D-ribosyltransferase